MNFLGMGPGELMVIMVLALIVFGPQKLPEMGRNLGKAIGEFRRATSSITEEINRELSLETPPAPAKKAETPAYQAPKDTEEAGADEPKKAPLMLEIKPSARAAAEVPSSNGVDVSAPPEETILESPVAYVPSDEAPVETSVVGSSVEAAAESLEKPVAPAEPAAPAEPEIEAAVPDTTPKPNPA